MAKSYFQGSLHIVGMDWRKCRVPASPPRGWVPAIYYVYCTCGNEFTSDAGEGGLAKCSVCGATGSINILALDWKNLPDKNMTQEYYRRVVILQDELLARADVLLKQLNFAKDIFIDKERLKALRPIQIQLSRLKWLIKKIIEAEKVTEASRGK